MKASNSKINEKTLYKSGECTLYHHGKALLDFIRNVDVTQTRIGEYSNRDYNSIGKVKPDLIVSGHQLFELATPSYIFTDIKTTIDASDKFNSIGDINAFQLINMYCDAIDCSNEEKKELAEKVRGINKNKAIIVPFKPHMACNIDYTDSAGKHTKDDAKIESIRWVTDAETHKIKCTISFRLNRNGDKLIKKSIHEYIKSFRISQIDLHTKSSKDNADMIQVTDFGAFRPVEFNSKDCRIVVDGSFVYYIESENNASIIGYWVNDKIRFVTNSNNKVIKKIKSSESLLRDHKDYMAPYGLLDTAVVNVK